MADTNGSTIYWRIENFDPLDDLRLKSQIFLIHSMNASWQIVIQLDEEKENLSAYLYKISNNVPFWVNYSLFVLTSSGWITILEKARKTLEAGGEVFGDDLVSLEKLKRKEWFYLPNGSLTISFHIFDNFSKNHSTQRLLISRFIDGETLHHRPIQAFSTLKYSDLFLFPHSYVFQITKRMKTQHTQTHVNAEDLNVLLKLFQEKEISFVTFRTRIEDFYVHKAVLCARSPVFNAMFERKMKENDCNIVDIDDIDNQTMALFVKFLHFDPLDDLKFSSALSLYYAADKYQIDSLKQMCVSILKKELSIENVCEVLLLSDLHQDGDLMNYAQEYFCQNSETVMPSKQWKDFLINTELVAKLLCKLAEAMP